MRTTIFTPEELEELRRYDALVDESPMICEDWKALTLVEDLLFPERVVARKANREANRERETARKRAYYLANREQVLATQKARRKSV